MGRDQDAPQKKRSARKRKVDPPFRGFVNYTLTAQDKKEFKQYDMTRTFEEHALPTLLGDGYRISLSYDDRTGAFMAAITTKDAESANLGLVLTARAGSDAFQAGMRACFLHYFVFEEIWPDPQVREDFQDEWEE